MAGGLRLLLVDNEKEYLALLQVILERAGYSTDAAENGQAAIKLIEENDYDVILTDMRMEGTDGMQLLEHINGLDKNIKCIVVTAYASVENAVEAMKKGAFSYFIKSNDPQELILNLQNLEKMKHLNDQNIMLKNDIASNNYPMESQSPEFQKVISYAEKVAKTDANVLILGESGVGKEVIARFIHQCSNRRNEIFMPVNCHSFSDSLLEAELYGHEKGAFTGSNGLRKGRFEAADKGTLFLDEIGEISLPNQSKILRNIENKEIERIGSNKSIKVDFRLICATNKNLKTEILNSCFREDLFYRINTFIIEIPPLRKRKEDLRPMIKYFLKKTCFELKKNVESIDEPLMDVLLNYDYPGNVRELKNIIERMIVLAENEKLTIQDISQYDIFSNTCHNNNSWSLRDVRQAAERNHIVKMLESFDFDMDETAAALEITSRQLYNKVNEYGLKLRKKQPKDS